MKEKLETTKDDDAKLRITSTTITRTWYELSSTAIWVQVPAITDSENRVLLFLPLLSLLSYRNSLLKKSPELVSRPVHCFRECCSQAIGYWVECWHRRQSNELQLKRNWRPANSFDPLEMILWNEWMTIIQYQTLLADSAQSDNCNLSLMKDGSQ
jgi:hypothetical protein